MRVPITKSVDPSTLAAQITAALGMPVAVSVRNPGQDDGAGGTLPGVIVLLDPATGQELPDQDVRALTVVLNTHVVPPTPPTPAQALVMAIAAATTLADLKTAVGVFAGGVVAQEDQAKRKGGGGKGGGGKGGGN